MALVYVVNGGSMEYALFHKLGHTNTNDLSEADIVCFTGGEDINPAIYGEKPIPGIYFNERRDAIEVEIYHDCVARNIDMVGICRGGQLLNALNGGTLWQHVDGHGRYHYLTDVDTDDLYWVSSTHHQQFRHGPDGEVIAIARMSANKFAEKETIKNIQPKDALDEEVVWYPETRCLCFQPHPEYPDNPQGTEYFAKLLIRFQIGEK